MENSNSMNLTTPSSISAPPSSGTSWFSGIVRSRSSASAKVPNKTPAAAGDGAGGGDGPINKKRQFRGVMFKYGTKSIQVAFKTGDYKQQVIFIGGLTDGFLATEYLEPLAIALEKERWSLVQFLFSSSYSGYGISSLKQDAAELDQLISYLINKEDSEGVVLLGHSTGCQAPASDREYRATLPETASMIDLASTMINEGRGSELMPREANPDSPITAYRFHSLCAYNGDDDMFSSDFNEDQLKQKLGHMSNTPTLVGSRSNLMHGLSYTRSSKAEIHSGPRKTLCLLCLDFTFLLCAAMGGAEKAEIEYGNHSLSNRAQEAVQAIIEFIKRDGPKGWDDPWS
ncbi:hypothetical protein SASPL_142433 [Salvia splendens]|uniref:Uncharacterized protein n=1 Tax=Salvia splendens TaxID=180675 RepID=A0A8X8WJ51_SALSN|nr:hypothetical protein SASPL_142433 [Salvia splendens]